ncbi:DUF6281 family protein [Streptomyces ziwulingensis]|uniref:Lipoprotein n=1 Tax=Streptomyces ziwulingensis TaxID=1045501 RepID=A0ABP9C9G8_9ACTN
MRRRAWTLASALTAVAFLAAAAACTVPGGGGGEAAASCAITATYGGRTYTDVGDIDFTLGAALGPAEFPPCADTPNDPGTTVGREPTRAYAVEGVDPRVAIAVRWDEDEPVLLAVRSDDGVPPEIEDLARLD